MKKYTILLLILSAVYLQAQNKIEFFRSVPSDSDITKVPAWAKLMYGEDPNVYEVIDQYSAFYNSNNFVKTIHTQNYKYWIKKVYSHVNKEGRIRLPSKSEITRKIIKEQEERDSKVKKSSSTSWTNIGPFETYFQGSTLPVSWQSNVYSITQSNTNPNLLVCGTEHGGVFMTLDKGASWNLISANESFCNSVTAVAISPTNDNVFYIGANGIIFKTVNAGATWTMSLNIDSEIHEIKINPSNANHIFSVSNAGLHESINGGTSWSQRFAERAWDLDFHPSNSSIIYLLKENAAQKKQEFYRSTNTGNTWALQSAGWYTPQNLSQANVQGGKIGVSVNSPNRVYAALIGNSKSGDDGWIGVYRSNNAGQNWTLPTGQIGSPYSNTCNVGKWNVAAYCGDSYHQGFFNFDLAVSPTNADLFWIGTIRLTESSDGGASFQSIGGSGTIRLNNIHADIQSIHVSGNDIWVASDGGINYSNDNLTTHSSRKYGISASAYWGFDIGWNEDVVVGGRYHNGNAVLYQPYGAGNSHQVGGVEEPTGHVNVMNNKRAYFGYYYSNPNGTSNSTLVLDIPNDLGGTITNYPAMTFRQNEHYVPWTTSEFTHHPNYSDNMIAGRLAALWQTKDAGQTWNILHDFGIGYVTEIEYSRSNPNVIYLINRVGVLTNSNSQIYKSLNGGQSWAPVTTPPTNDSFRFTIACNPLNENEIWAAAPQGANGSKVYRSMDGGLSWMNMTSSVLNNQDVYDIEFQGGSSGIVYLLTRNNFFYYNPATSSWVQYNTNLPFNLSDGEIKTIKLFYRDKKIRLSSSRGIWEVDFALDSAPVAEPITNSDIVECNQSLVQLESFSMVDQDATQWSWTISPTPQFISDVNARNPQVIFGTPGSYDVSLTVTNSLGQSHTKSVQDMITVNSDCPCPPCVGCSPDYLTNGDVQIDNSSCCIDLTYNTTWSVGSVWVKEKINFNQSFDLSFDIDLGDISGGDVDGVALVFQNQGFNALGNPGSELGRNGISQSLAVAFRSYIWDNIEIWANGSSCCGNDVSGSPYPISGSGSHPVRINWDAYTNTLSIDWDANGNDIIFNNDIINNYFGGNPNNIIWGFTGATGGLAGTNRVCNLSLKIDDCPPAYSVANNNKLTGVQSTSTTFMTNGIIESDEIINPLTTINYQSNSSIELVDNFELKLGAVFHAFIEGCL